MTNSKTSETSCNPAAESTLFLHAHHPIARNHKWAHLTLLTSLLKTRRWKPVNTRSWGTGLTPQSQRAIEIKAGRMSLLARTQGSRKDLYANLLISFTPSCIILLLSEQSLILVYSVIKPVFFSCFQAFQHSSESKQTHFKTLPGSKTLKPASKTNVSTAS